MHLTFLSSLSIVISLMICGTTGFASLPTDLDIYTSAVDNNGDGDMGLYGTRNFKMVLKGLLYRTGANNVNDKTNPRELENPMPDIGLKNLCQKGVYETFALLPFGMDEAPKSLSCASLDDGEQRQMYYNHRSFWSPENRLLIFRMIVLSAKYPSKGAIVLQDLDGSSVVGMMSAIALMQFCDWTTAEALTYFDKTNIRAEKSPQDNPANTPENTEEMKELITSQGVAM